MPREYNVSEITNIVSSAIQQDSSLQNVWIYGILKILQPNLLRLSGTGCSIDCPNHGEAALFVGLEREREYYAYGKVIVNPQKSEYRFAVTRIQPNSPPNSSMDLRNLTSMISQTIMQLGIVQVQAKISSINPPGTLLNLEDANSNGEMIECAIPPGINPNIDLNLGDDVRVRGPIDIFRNLSRYQIRIENADDIMSSPSLERCQCSGCESCRPLDAECNQTRNSQYELCSSCYEISPDHEEKVERAVETYFSELQELQVRGFSPKTQHGIQIGYRSCIADVVLTNENGSFAAIAECKGAGYEGHGIDQLKSYLSTTDTRFGIFANRADRTQWKFYENLRGNYIPEIDCSEFEAGVVEGVANRERLRDEIAGLKNQKSALDTEIRQVSQTKRNLTQQVEALENYKPELHEEIHGALNELLEEKMQRLETDLKSELNTAVEALQNYKPELHEEIHRSVRQTS